jgi:Recombinase zinc beta ribbon domain
VRDYPRDPLNVGVGRSFRYRSQDAPPDETHDYAWTKRVDTPADQQIEIPGVVQPPFLLTPDEAAQIERRLATSQRFRPATPQTAVALLRGGVARCGQIGPDGTPCGGALRVRYDHRNDTYTYVCRAHEQQPARCSGVSIPGTLLDTVA